MEQGNAHPGITATVMSKFCELRRTHDPAAAIRWAGGDTLRPVCYPIEYDKRVGRHAPPADPRGEPARNQTSSLRTAGVEEAGVSAPQLPFVDFAGIGPAVGERFPDVVLPDQHGMRLSLSQRRRNRRTLVVVYRSASW